MSLPTLQVAVNKFEWTACDDYNNRLLAQIEVHGAFCHLEAVAVDKLGHAIDEDYEDMIIAAHRILGSAPMQSTELLIDGKPKRFVFILTSEEV